jgi:signal transduction histidine kinase
LETLTASPSTNSPSFLAQLGRHLAHELNNPISAISSAVYLLEEFISSAEDGKLSVEEVQPFIVGIREECDSLKSTVQEFSRFVTTESVLMSPLEITEFLRKRAEDFTREGLPVRFEQSEGTHTIFADAGGLQTVLRSIVENAIESGATTVTFRAHGNPTEITISDDRQSQFTPEECQSLFEPLGARHSRVGLGLKLPLAKKIVDLHHGVIEMEMKPGGGAEVRIRIPETTPAEAAVGA